MAPAGTRRTVACRPSVVFTDECTRAPQLECWGMIAKFVKMKPLTEGFQKANLILQRISYAPSA